MLFDWDPTKHARNLTERGFGFDVAALIFEGPTIEHPDDRHDYREPRIRTIGAVDGLILHVVYTDRNDIRRIISARPATRKERRQWHNHP